MESVLVPHPSDRMRIIDGLRVRARRESRTRLHLEFEVKESREASVFLAPLAAPSRADALWTTTCFEAFLKRPGADVYIELNISPSGRWASYAFDSYRTGMRIAERVILDRFALQAIDGTIRVSAVFEVADATFAEADVWHAGFAAIIESAERDVSHWALLHTGERPDFHAGDCFTAVLRAPAPE